MTELLKKLNFKNHTELLILNPPVEFKAEMEDMQKYTRIAQDIDKCTSAEFIIKFATKKEEVDLSAPVIMSKAKGDTIIWYAYPKKSSKKYSCDFDRDNGWDILGSIGLEPVRMVAIDADWSALRFRKVQYIKTMTRSSALTTEGKERISKNK